MEDETQPPTYEKGDYSMTSNDINITCSQITGMQYLANSLYITKGEASAPPPTFVNNKETWTITIKADRKGSAPVADSFDIKSGGSAHEYDIAGEQSGKRPDALNFYFGVVITFNVNNVMANVTVYLGQGHNAGDNNWWIGGESVVNDNDGSHHLSVISEGHILEVLKITGTSNYSMTLTQIS
jgi:hypothetical protein